jgi:hypothetical protein
MIRAMDEGTASETRRRPSWRVIVGVVVALVLGAGVGAFAEHKRALDKSNAVDAPSASKPSTPTASPWFAATSTACPGIQQWYSGLGKAVYLVISKHGAWPSTQQAIVPPMKEMETGYSALLPQANAAGKLELQFLLTSAQGSREALQQSPSEAAFFQSLGSGGQTARLQADFAIMLQAVKSCSA